uniref:Uncharacterized protein n=1 Tax=Pipistrellus kuhlii TaxID=59472 RepID=A0A7J8B1L5_PIPKU|nr:hypothetical protein mPipKuh1_007743 [Pipistrellus kuhlii]
MMLLMHGNAAFSSRILFIIAQDPSYPIHDQFWVLLLYLPFLFNFKSWNIYIYIISLKITFYLIGGFTSNYCNFMGDVSSLKSGWVVLHTAVLCPSNSVYRSFIKKQLMRKRQVVSDRLHGALGRYKHSVNLLNIFIFPKS